MRRPIERRAVAPSASSVPTPAAAPRPGGLTDAEAARAAELEAALLAEERAADDARRRTRERSSATRDVVLPGGSLARRAEEEYAYVGRDVRDIVRIATILLVILLGLWILVDVAKVIPIG
jgi:hypothetical protein